MARATGRRRGPPGPLAGQTVATLFAEPSTRTRVSFELAARALGGDPVSLDAASSSLAKGESLIDTVRTLEALGAAMLVVRHPRSGAPQLASEHFGGPVLNAGDGWHAHPTQALLDLYTLRQVLGEQNGSPMRQGVHRGRRAPLARGPLRHLGAHLLGHRRLAHGPDRLPARFRGVGAGPAVRPSADGHWRPRGRHHGRRRGHGAAGPAGAARGRRCAVGSGLRRALGPDRGAAATVRAGRRS